MAKREPDCSMTINIEDKSIDVEIFIDEEYKALRYELTSKEEIDPSDSAFILLAIAKSICDDQGIDINSLMNNYEESLESEIH